MPQGCRPSLAGRCAEGPRQGNAGVHPRFRRRRRADGSFLQETCRRTDHAAIDEKDEHHQAQTHDQRRLSADDAAAEPKGQAADQQRADKGTRQRSAPTDQDVDRNKQTFLYAEYRRRQIVGPVAEQRPGKASDATRKDEQPELDLPRIVAKQFGLYIVVSDIDSANVTATLALLSTAIGSNGRSFWESGARLALLALVLAVEPVSANRLHENGNFCGPSRRLSGTSRYSCRIRETEDTGQPHENPIKCDTFNQYETTLSG